MSYMVYVSQESGLLTEEEKQRIISCMVSLELPVWHQACTMELIQKSLQDRLKHSGGLVRMPLPVGLGQAGKNHKSEAVFSQKNSSICGLFKQLKRFFSN